MTISRLYSNAASATSLWEFMWWEHQSVSHYTTRRVQIVETTIPLLLLLLVLLLVLCWFFYTRYSVYLCRPATRHFVNTSILGAMIDCWNWYALWTRRDISGLSAVQVQCYYSVLRSPLSSVLVPRLYLSETRTFPIPTEQILHPALSPALVSEIQFRLADQKIWFGSSDAAKRGNWCALSLCQFHFGSSGPQTRSNYSVLSASLP